MRRVRTACRVMRRCAIFCITIAIVPVLLVIVITSDQHFRQRSTPEFYNDTYEPSEPITLHIKQSVFNSEKLKKIATTMAKRSDKLKSECSKYGLDVQGNDSLHKPNPWEFLVNRERHLVWCNVFKAASTSWMYNFNLLAGYTPQFLKKTNIVPLQLARKKYPRPSLAQLKASLNDSISFLIVRHPFERLLSAYRDKLQFALPHSLHKKLGTQIILKYRLGGQKSKLYHVLSGPRWPTFGEFVKFLMDEVKAGRELDMHWTPITQFCTPCLLHFDIIAKFETLKEDQLYLIHRAGLKGLISPQWKNSGRGRTTTELVANYYSQLTKEEIRQLYGIYKYDFDLFGYDLNGYIDYGIPDIQRTPSTSTTTEDILKLSK